MLQEMYVNVPEFAKFVNIFFCKEIPIYECGVSKSNQ